jgi:ribosomal protein S18 acetylase RimI-like enzyme
MKGLAQRMTIRKATYQETQEILSYSQNVAKESTMGLVDAPLVFPTSEDDGYYLVYSENNVIKGWIGIASTLNYYDGEIVGIISEVYVIPQYRRNGIARQLCIEGVNDLKERGHLKVQLNVFEGNGAKQLYQKLGFREVSILMEKNMSLDISE